MSRLTCFIKPPLIIAIDVGVLHAEDGGDGVGLTGVSGRGLGDNRSGIPCPYRAVRSWLSLGLLSRFIPHNPGEEYF